ncbi:hypothetical protein M885DRAFT_443632 [Pelagophyceae sp. CCMP2097]|nr:hypothetical protein M885DRAFT_443632 [Pelagophyceae sp. CCMP2097]
MRTGGGASAPLRDDASLTVGSTECVFPREAPLEALEVDFAGDDAPPHSLKTIGYFGSMALIINNVSGPGMLDFPAAFQSAGWVPCVFTICCIAATSAGVGTLVCDTVAKLWHEEPTSRVEFSSIFERTLGKKWAATTQILFFLNLFSQNVAAIIDTAQATDQFVATVFGRTCAIKFEADGVHVDYWASKNLERAESDAGATPTLTLGYLICLFTLAPLGFCSLQENMIFQKVSFILLCLLVTEFLAEFIVHFGDGDVPAFGGEVRDVVGVVLFNFAFCVTIPSWLNEKEAGVSAPAVICKSCGCSALVYIAVGWLGALSLAHPSDNLLKTLTAPESAFVTRLCGGVFAYGIIGLGIPIFCVLMRYNLVAGGICEPRAALFFAAALPWLLSWLAYQGHGVLGLLSWAGLVLNSAVDFILPMVAVLAASHLPQLPYDLLLPLGAKCAHADDCASLRLPQRLAPYHCGLSLVLLTSITAAVFLGLFVKIHAAVQMEDWAQGHGQGADESFGKAV